MFKNKSPGHEGPDKRREPRAIEPHDAAPQTDAGDFSSGQSHHSVPAGPVQTRGDVYTPDPLFDFDGGTADGCVLCSSGPVGFSEGETVLDTGWHVCDAITIRVVFTAGEPDSHHRDWMQNLLLSGFAGLARL